jgi:hypothetical protein
MARPVKSVEFTGDWQEFYSWCNWLISGSYMPRLEKMAEQIGSVVRATLRQHILAQDLGWQKLAESTKARKGHPIIYIGSGVYMNSIGLEVAKQSDTDISVRIFPDGYYEDRGKNVDEIAFYMEYGTKNMPARPLWRPVYEAARNMDSITKFDLEGLFMP